jgi:hypothetical protein
VSPVQCNRQQLLERPVSSWRFGFLKGHPGAVLDGASDGASSWLLGCANLGARPEAPRRADCTEGPAKTEPAGLVPWGPLSRLPPHLHIASPPIQSAL